jgi:hypothetical protein
VSAALACELCRPGAPTGGTLSLDVETMTTYASDSCRIKSAGGPLTIDWSDGTTSTGSFTGRFHDGKPILVVSVVLTTSSGPFHPPTSWKGVLEGFPPNPCMVATSPITGSLKA